MRILHAANWYFPESLGGVEVYVAELARRQRVAGLAPVVVAPDSAASSVRSYEWEGTQVLRYPLNAPDIGFAECLRRVAPDVVHVHSLSTGLGIDQIAAARSVARRVIFTAHLPALGYVCQRGTLLRWGVEPCDGVMNELRCAACAIQERGVSRSAARMIASTGRRLGVAADLVPGRLGTGLRMTRIIAANRERQGRLFQQIDHFVGLNGRALEIVRGNGAPQPKLVLNRLGVGAGLVRKPSPARRPTASPVHVGFIGRIHETKGLGVLAHAVRELPADLPIRVSIFGPTEGQDSSALVARLADTAARDPRVRLCGPLGREDVPRTLAELDVLCCPSIWFENGPTIALEALAVGTPVVGTDLGAMPEFIAHGVNGLILPPGQWAPLRDALEMVARCPSTVDAWRIALPQPRTMDDVARDYECLYDGRPVAI